MPISKLPSLEEEATYLPISHFVCELLSDIISQPSVENSYIEWSFKKQFSFLAIERIINVIAINQPIEELNEYLENIAMILVFNYYGGLDLNSNIAMLIGSMAHFNSYVAHNQNLATDLKQLTTYQDTQAIVSFALSAGVANSHASYNTQNLPEANPIDICYISFMDTFSFSLAEDFVLDMRDNWTDYNKLSTLAFMSIPIILSESPFQKAIMIDYFTISASSVIIPTIHNLGLYFMNYSLAAEEY